MVGDEPGWGWAFLRKKSYHNPLDVRHGRGALLQSWHPIISPSHPVVSGATAAASCRWSGALFEGRYVYLRELRCLIRVQRSTAPALKLGGQGHQRATVPPPKNRLEGSSTDVVSRGLHPAALALGRSSLIGLSLGSDGCTRHETMEPRSSFVIITLKFPWSGPHSSAPVLSPSRPSRDTSFYPIFPISAAHKTSFNPMITPRWVAGRILTRMRSDCPRA